MAVELGQAPEITVFTLSDGDVVAVVGDSSVRTVSVYVDGSGANVAVTYSEQTDGDPPVGSNYLIAPTGGGIEDLELLPGDTLYLWRLSATSTTVRIATGRGR